MRWDRGVTVLLIGLTLVTLFKDHGSKIDWRSWLPDVIQPEPPPPVFPERLQRLRNLLRPALGELLDSGKIRDLAALFFGIARLVGNQGRSDVYSARNQTELHDRMLQMGDLVIGPDWEIGERYPQLPQLVADHVGSTESPQQAAERFKEVAETLYYLALETEHEHK